MVRQQIATLFQVGSNPTRFSKYSPSGDFLFLEVLNMNYETFCLIVSRMIRDMNEKPSRNGSLVIDFPYGNKNIFVISESHKQAAIDSSGQIMCSVPVYPLAELIIRIARHFLGQESVDHAFDVLERMLRGQFLDNDDCRSISSRYLYRILNGGNVIKSTCCIRDRAGDYNVLKNALMDAVSDPDYNAVTGVITTSDTVDAVWEQINQIMKFPVNDIEAYVWDDRGTTTIGVPNIFMRELRRH